MIDKAPESMTATEIEACADRIAGWAAKLPAGALAVFDAMLMRASAPRDDVGGYLGLLPASSRPSAQDRMGNFEIQRLMSAYNQAETLASSVLRKLDDTRNADIGKI